MDKFRQVQEFSHFAAEEFLPAASVRLYLLLLAHSGPGGRGRTTLAAIRRGMGEHFSFWQMEASLRTLATKRLIDVSLPIDRDSADAVLNYRLLPVPLSQKS